MDKRRAGMAMGVLLLVLPAHAAEAPPQLVEESRTAAGQLVQRVGGQLRKEMEFSGPLRSIMVCKYVSQEAAAEISRRNGWRVSRVSLKPRNPLTGVPDSWEQQTLLEFDRRVAAGEKPEAIEKADVVNEPNGRYFRYMKALPVQKMCLECHGTLEQIPAAVRLRLATEYPHDQATGYTVGQVRGAVSIKRLMP